MTILIDSKELDMLRSLNVATRVRKTVSTYARPATAEDVLSGLVSPQINLPATPGFIQTLEGLVPFQEGDYVCKGCILGELWPISAARFASIKVFVSGPDQEGWSVYDNTNTVWAIQIVTPFCVQLSSSGTQVFGNENDYLIYDDKSAWPLAEELFSTTYKPV